MSDDMNKEILINQTNQISLSSGAIKGIAHVAFFKCLKDQKIIETKNDETLFNSFYKNLKVITGGSIGSCVITSLFFSSINEKGEIDLNIDLNKMLRKGDFGDFVDTSLFGILKAPFYFYTKYGPFDTDKITNFIIEYMTNFNNKNNLNKYIENKLVNIEVNIDEYIKNNNVDIYKYLLYKEFSKDNKYSFTFNDIDYLIK